MTNDKDKNSISSSLDEALSKAETLTNHKILLTSWAKLQEYPNVFVSISGGADSDIMLDILERTNLCNADITYCFFDTGIEYQATKDHLKKLEQKYGITIKRKKSKCPVPLAVHKYGVPFLSKRISMYIGRLQKHNFQWQDLPFDELVQKYPKCISALKWWCNQWGENSSFNISRSAFLKEFLIANPPKFRISDECCNKAKKSIAHDALKSGEYKMNCTGVRRCENGVRSTIYHNCFTPADDQNDIANYRPLFFMNDEDKAIYEQNFDVSHSCCYTQYGLKRTGCAGCPFGSRFEEELDILKQHEPKLYKAVNNIFGQSYEYTRAYRKFKEEMKKKKKDQ